MSHDPSPPGRWETAFLTLALLDQQDAFLNVFRTFLGHDALDEVGAVSDPTNILLVAATLAGLGCLFARRPQILLDLLKPNGVILALSAWALLSIVWSDAPGLSLRRGIVHLNTVLLALYIAGRMSFWDAVRCLARSIAMSAVGSWLVALGDPSYGVMHKLGLEGRWRGVFSHKNPLAEAMAFGCLLEAGLLGCGAGRRGWTLLLLELGLIVKAGSDTALLIAVLGLSGLGLAAAVRRRPALGRPLLVAAPLAMGVFIAVTWLDPGLIEQVSGRDASLTGRTALWAEAMNAALARPWLGYGFQAFWSGVEPKAGLIWAAIGWNAPNAHNGLLETGLGLGAVGVGLTLAFMLQGFGRGLRLLAAPTLRWAGVLSLSLLTAVTIESATEAVLVQQGNFAWLLVVCLSFAAQKARRDGPPRGARGWRLAADGAMIYTPP